jgi:hypothetical protein
MDQTKRSRNRAGLALALLLLAGFFVGCTEDGGTPTYTVTGTITINGNLVSNPAATNETIRVGIDTSLVDIVTLDLLDIAYQTSASIADGTASYSYTITGVPAGTYYLACSIDVDGNGVLGVGDYVAILGNLNPGDPLDPSDDPAANFMVNADEVSDLTIVKL